MKINGFIPLENMQKVQEKNNINSKSDTNIDFGSIFQKSMDELNEMQVNADKKTEDFIKGEDIDVHEVMLASEEAKMSLQLAVQVKNKIVETIQELTKMQI